MTQFSCVGMTTFTLMMGQMDGTAIVVCTRMEMVVSIAFLARSEHHPTLFTSNFYRTTSSTKKDGWLIIE